MLWEVFKFEIKYRLNRPATYIYFVIWFLLAFSVMCWDGITVGGDIGKIKQNASVVLFNIAGILSLLPGLFFASAVMGVPILRDFEHKMESLVFTTNINKTSYLLGRFLGSFVVLLFISSGFMWGGWLGAHMPWNDATKFLPITLMQFARPWLILIVFNMFVFSCLFFAIGALTRKMLFVYLQAIILLAIYIVVETLVGDVENLKKAALFDPFGSYSISALTRYWTVAERNVLQVPFSGVLLLNRLLWIGVGFLFFAITFAVFKFRAVYTGLFKKRFFQSNKVVAADNSPVPFVKPSYSAGTWLSQINVLTRLYFKEVVRSIPFIGIGLVGIILIGIDANFASSYYGQELYPVSSLIASFIADEVVLIISIMVLFYSGELIWREKEVRFSQIFDSLPVGYAAPIVSKFLAMAGMLLVYLAFMIPVGIIIQLAKGFTFIELGVYIKILFFQVYIPMLIYTAMTFFLQSLFNNKFVGYAVSILFYIYILFAGQMKIFYNLLIPNSGGVGQYSDMNGFAASMDKYLVLKCFWIAIGGILLTLAILLYQRGTSTGFRERLTSMRQRFGRAQAVFMAACLVVAVASGFYYYQNANVWNEYSNPEEQKDLQVSYEKQLKAKYEKALQPSVVNVVGSVNIYPEKEGMDLNAMVTYKNLMRVPISLLLVQQPNDPMLKYSELKFSVPMTVVKMYPKFKFTVYKLSKPLLPGDSMLLHVVGARLPKGFTNSGPNYSYVENGTFFNNTDVFPFLGYSTEYELGDTDDRKKRGLKEQKGLPSRTDSVGRMLNLFGQRGRTGLDLTLSTSADQIAISPGYLKKQWKQNGRAYFHYQMDKPIFNFFNITSGRFEVKREKWKGVNLEVYYHKPHNFNLGIMMAALKNGLEYDNKNFSPYLYRQMRIIEFPKYRGFAQSFPNTVPFSENIGFLFRKQPEKLDMCYYVTAHELGHQWWGHQVCEANTVGGQMFSEGLAQYSAIMLLKKSLSVEELRRYLKYELDQYLRGRSSERKAENPLDQTDQQQYIHYQKGTLAYFALQDYIGEDKVNQALRKLIANYGNGDKYPTSDVLTGYFKEVTPDSLKYVVDDLFSKITLFENRVVEPTAKKVKDGYEVTIPIQSIKYYADKAGNEKRTTLHDYIDVGVFAMQKGKEKLVYLQRQKLTSEKNTIKVMMKEKPVRAGIDPVYKLVDRNTEDNTAVVEIK
ncbi:M1 family aminopeptidase [Mucilaginibacter galii]|uniref:Membrane protein n=1 Tax=Mucilaginibacter galii TaxID=2005073 RepID=A0A917J5W3_9SPHI|nr:M1 family aminopeptidase [Mucilaginibacter galii]GGI49254.1 membrane protein [Mucilaginibacter galii]